MTVIVVVDEPSIKPYYGGKWAAPIFRKIIDESFNISIFRQNKEKKENGQKRRKKIKHYNNE